MIEEDNFEKLSIITHDAIKNAEYYLYVKNNPEKSIEMADTLFLEFISKLSTGKKVGNKHKCNRDESCECIQLGTLIIDANMINLEFSCNHNSKFNLIEILEKYYYNPTLYLPCLLFKKLCKALIKLLDFQAVRSMIENYLTYSRLITNKKISNHSLLIISLKDYEELNHLLIFESILILSGFNKAKSKILSIEDEGIKQKFLVKFEKILYNYTKEKERNDMAKYIYEEKDEYSKVTKYDPKLYSKITNLINNKVETAFNFNNSYSNYQMKNSLLNRIVSIILNKKFLIALLLVVTSILIYKKLKKVGVDSLIVLNIKKILLYLLQFKMFKGLVSLSSGIFELLVNY